MEELRPIVADSVVLTVLNKRIVGPEDFQAGPGGRGVLLKPEALRVFVGAFAARLQTRLRHPDYRQPATYQRLLEVQARALVRFLEGKRAAYEALLTR
jgi:CRISPR-associated protein Cas1